MAPTVPVNNGLLLFTLSLSESPRGTSLLRRLYCDVMTSERGGRGREGSGVSLTYLNNFLLVVFSSHQEL